MISNADNHGFLLLQTYSGFQQFIASDVFSSFYSRYMFSLIAALLIYESHNYNEEKVQLKIEESVTNILPGSLMVTRIQDIAEILKTKRKGCNIYWMKYISLNMHICEENLSAEVNFLFFKKKCHAYAIAGTNLKNVLQMMLYTVGA